MSLVTKSLIVTVCVDGERFGDLVVVGRTPSATGTMLSQPAMCALLQLFLAHCVCAGVRVEHPFVVDGEGDTLCGLYYVLACANSG